MATYVAACARRPLFRVAFVLAGHIGCGRPTFTIGLPTIDADRAAILATSDSAGMSVLAFEPVASRSEAQLDLREGDATLTLLSYTLPLPALGLEEGALEPDPTGRPLPAFDAAFEAGVGRDGVEPWREITELPPAVAAFRAKRRSACRELSLRGITEVGDMGWQGIGLVPIDGTSALLLTAGVTFERRFYRVSRIDGAFELIDLGLGTFRTDAMIGTGEGRIVLAGTSTAGTEIRIGDFAGGFETVFSDTAGVVQIALGRSDDPADTIYGITGSSELVRFALGSAKERLAPPTSFGDDGALAVLGSRDVLFAPRSGDTIYHAQGGEVRQEPTPIDDAIHEEVIRNLYADDETVLMGTSLGSIVERRDGRWALVDTVALAVSTRSMMPYEGGVLITGGLGLVQQLDRQGGLCEAFLLGQGYTFTGAVPSGDVIIVTGYRFDADNSDEIIPTIAVVEAR